VRAVAALCRDLLGAAPDTVTTLVRLADRANYRVTVRGERFVVKTDDDRRTMTNEIAGYRRAMTAGLLVPELVAEIDDAFAIRWVDGVSLREHGTRAAWTDAGVQVRAAHDVGGEPPFGTGFGGFNPTQPTWRAFFEAFADEMVRTSERDLGFPAEHAARIRAAVRAAPLDDPLLAWCLGDLQPEHVLVDPTTDRVAGIIDLADQGTGDFAWDVAVLTLEDGDRVDDFFAGYGATASHRAAYAAVGPVYSVARLVGEAGWLAEHGLPYEENLRRAVEWPL
jgi:aminoglycoside phosphotransferase (APT) family kinase protein